MQVKSQFNEYKNIQKINWLKQDFVIRVNACEGEST